jgi:hypothetical protein
VPGFLRARKRSQASRILNDLRMIDAAVDHTLSKPTAAPISWFGTADWTNYLKKVRCYTTQAKSPGQRLRGADGRSNSQSPFK